MNKRRAFIVGLKNTFLDSDEIFFLKKNKPWGVILFHRNIKNLIQATRLVNQIKKCFDDKYYPILIDEEGGSVSRLKNILDTEAFTARSFGNYFNINKNNCLLNYQIYINTISEILNKIGVNINTVPVLDVRRLKTNRIINDRSYSSKKKVVSELGNYCIKYYGKNKIATVIKHLPGHGLSRLDSHLHLPLIKESKKILNEIDFMPFKNKKTFLGMTAHIIYHEYDPFNSATHSKTVINDIIRKKIKFRNILITDDISMKSLKFGFKKNIIKSYDAGCNLVLHCNGKMNEMKQLAKISPLLDKFTVKKTSQLYKFLM